jgi:hypothetical protein
MRAALVMKLADDAHKWGKPQQVDRGQAVSVKELCDQAGINCLAFGHFVDFKMIALIEGKEHYLLIEEDGPFYSVGRDFIDETNPPDIALRVLEVLAYTFHEYASRESLYRRGFFVAPLGSYQHRKTTITMNNQAE